MRIISGMAGGVRLEAPEGHDVRPTEDRVKESMFSTLGDFSDKVVLDLFAGTGALGLEALSRGAKCVHGFERERRNALVTAKNIAAVERALHHQGGYILHTEDASNASKTLPALRGNVNLILADPPYETVDGAYGWYELMMDRDLAAMMAPGGMLMLEHGSEKELPLYPESPWKCIRSKAFGIRCVSYCIRAEENR